MTDGSDSSENLLETAQRCKDYLLALEEELRKIRVFERELPLCLDIVSRTIEACKHKLLGSISGFNVLGQSESSEQTSNERPVFEEFIPLNRASSPSDVADERKHKKPRNKDHCEAEHEVNYCEKSEWLRSAQLWKDPDPPSISKEILPIKEVVEVKENAFRKGKSCEEGCSCIALAEDGAAPPASECSLVVKGGAKKKQKKDAQPHRKSRRSWSSNLHQRFLHALKQLGGSQLATPKQIRELMKEDGLTNDEVKSHLQKYRLHTRTSAPSLPAATQPPQFVVVGGIWVPSPTASVESTGGRIFAPIATRPHSPQGSRMRSRLGDKGSHSNSEGGDQTRSSQNIGE